MESCQVVEESVVHDSVFIQYSQNDYAVILREQKERMYGGRRIVRKVNFLISIVGSQQITSKLRNNNNNINNNMFSNTKVNSKRNVSMS